MDERIDCVMLAAGVSSRMGKWKMTLPCKGSTIIECSVGNALQVCSRVILVTGYRVKELEQLFHDWKQVELVYNAQYEKAMFSSVKLGVSLIRTKRFFLALGDMPLVDQAVYERLLSFPQAPAVIPKYRGKKGHPILLSCDVVKCIAKLEETRTLKDVLARFPTLTVPVENKHILNDIDNPKDYKNIIDTRL